MPQEFWPMTKRRCEPAATRRSPAEKAAGSPWRKSDRFENGPFLPAHHGLL